MLKGRVVFDQGKRDGNLRKSNSPQIVPGVLGAITLTILYFIYYFL